VTRIAALEKASYATWTADTSEEIDGWHVTATAGVSRRVNSARAVGEVKFDDQTRERLSAWFASQSLPMIVRETPLMTEATSAAVREQWNFDAYDETLVMSAASARSPARGVRTVSLRNTTFQLELAELNDYSGEDAETLRRLYARVAKKGAGLWIPGTAVAVVVRYHDDAAVFSVAVGETSRRTGVGTRIMEAASTWASKRGVRSLFVQVLGTNRPAVALYNDLGFSNVYRYRYLQQTAQ